MSLKRVLFVDDDVPVLESLKRLFRKERSRWDMVFASSGEAALAQLALAPADVVISDMQMPGIDGAELLTRIKDRYPATRRLVLTGDASQGAVMRALPVSHQFLSKPCDPLVLREAVERSCQLQDVLSDPALRRVVGGMAHLPPASATYAELVRLIADSRSGAKDIARVLEEDPALSAKVLQVVNSAFFGPPQRITSVTKAVVLLGAGMVRALMLSEQVFGAVGRDPQARAVVDHYQRRSMAVADLARRFLLGSAQADDAFIGGLLHDVGAVVVGLDLHGEEGRIEAQVAAGRPRLEAEREVLGVTHAEIGSYLLGTWGLPSSIVEVAAYHHRPSAMTEGQLDVVAAVHAADAFVEGAGEAAMDLEFLERIKLGAELPRWRELAAEAKFRGANSTARPRTESGG